MKISGSIALVTGANRGIGSEYVSQLLERGAAKIYVAARDPESLKSMVDGGGGKLVPLKLDVTNADDVASAAALASDVTLLINNAGYAAFEGAMSAGDMKAARQEMEVNYFGKLALCRAFAPLLASSGGGVIVNMLSMLGLLSLPAAATYSASKAAALSVTRSIRAELASQKTAVIGVMAIQTETDMGGALPEPRLSPHEVVSDVLDAVEAGKSEEVFAGELTRQRNAGFETNPKGVQDMLLQMLPQKR
jgi:NAD(P)-dependent dehydrogenase (short-subunit alcohol dehydrogenase family)